MPFFACLSVSTAGGHTAFVRLNLFRTNGLVFAVDKICHFCLFAREIWSGTLPPHFFRSYEKSAKKVRGGCAHPLDSRGRRKTKTPLRSAGFTAILEIPQYAETQKTQFIFTPYRHSANTSMFFGNFWVLVILGFGFISEFSCWNLWHENGRVFA